MRRFAAAFSRPSAGLAPYVGLTALCVLALAGCSQQQVKTALPFLTDAQAGTVATVTQTAAADGQLFCTANGILLQVAGANVIGATGPKVADVCAKVQLGVTAIAAVPAPAAPGQTAVMVQPNPAALAAMNASKPAG